MKDQFVGLHIDFIGFVASALCAIHCAGLPLLLSVMPLMGLGFLENPWIEYSIIFFSFLIASFALISGYRRYHKRPMALVFVIIGFSLIALGHGLGIEASEVVLTTIGALTISIAHVINWKHMRQALANR